MKQHDPQKPAPSTASPPSTSTLKRKSASSTKARTKTGGPRKRSASCPPAELLQSQLTTWSRCYSDCTLVVGIDPGHDGALVSISATTGDIIQKYAMPTITQCGELRTWSGQVIGLLRNMIGSHLNSVMIAIEALPRHAQSKAAMRMMAMGWGLAYAAAERMSVPVIEVKAGNSLDGWQRALLRSVPKGYTKEAALHTARELWPSESWIAPGCRTPHPGYVDAALIAHYALRRLREFQSR